MPCADRQIAAQVYELYGLTEEEIKIVEVAEAALTEAEALKLQASLRDLTCVVIIKVKATRTGSKN